MKQDCLFCGIVRGEIPAKIVHRQEDILAFADIDPQAPAHVLVIPAQHIGGMNRLTAADDKLMGQILLTAARIARREGLEQTGYRLVINTGSDGGQTVPHLHAHILGGRPLAWPPG